MCLHKLDIICLVFNPNDRIFSLISSSIRVVYKVYIGLIYNSLCEANTLLHPLDW